VSVFCTLYTPYGTSTEAPVGILIPYSFVFTVHNEGSEALKQPLLT
jgi:hypothetical protein